MAEKKVFYFGFVLFAIAAIGSGSAPSIGWLIFFRGIQGFAGAIIFTVGVALLPQAFPPEEQDRAIGVFSAFNGAGLAIGPFLSGSLITLFSWRWVFWINLPIIFIGAVLCFFTLQSDQRVKTVYRMDWLGFLLLVISIGSLTYGMIAGEESNWTSIVPLALIVLGVLTSILLVLVERNKDHALLDLTLFKNEYALLAIYICITAGLITSVFMFFDPLYLEAIQNYSAFNIGLILLAVPIVQVIISVYFEKIVVKTGVRSLIVVALLTGLLSAMIHCLFAVNSGLFIIISALILMGYSWGIANVGSIAALSKTIDANRMGNAVGTVFTFWNISNAIFLALASVIFHSRETSMLSVQLRHLREHALDADALQQLNAILADPSHARMILNNLQEPYQSVVNQLYQYSFMHGFRSAAFFACMVMVALVLATIVMLMRKRHHSLVAKQ